MGCLPPAPLRGYSSTGRAPALQAGGCGFEPRYLHQIRERAAAIRSGLIDLVRRAGVPTGAAGGASGPAPEPGVRGHESIFDNRIRDAG